MEYVPLETTFFDALNLSITPGVSLSGVIATLMALMFVGVSLAALYGFTMVGIYRIEPSEQRLSKSKEFFKKTVLGILGIFLMFLIVSFINEDILFSDVKLDALRNKGVVGNQTTPNQQSGTPVQQGSGAGWEAIRQDPQIRASLAALPYGGISVNKAVCTNPSERNCTTVGGLPQATLDMLRDLRNTCPNAQITVSGGTEGGHSSHGPGKYPVDLSLTSSLGSCIRSFPKSTRVPKRANGSNLCNIGQVYEKFGYIFCDESFPSAPHWHVYKM